MSDQTADDGPHYEGPEADETETGDAPDEGNVPDEPTEPQPWPNQEPVVDGIVPTEEVDQDPDLFADDDDDPEMEMED